MSSNANKPTVIPNHYLVVFKSHVDAPKAEAHCAWAHELHTQKVGTLSTTEAEQYAGVHTTYRFHSWAGYAGSFDPETRAMIEEHEDIDFVEPDYKVYTCGMESQTDAPSWGLARLSHKSVLTGETKSVYTYDESAGEGVTAYIIDTGIFAEHEDFEGRATFGHNAVKWSTDTDMNGHGTHVSGTIGSKTYGVAKKATLIGVKVLGDDGSGTNSGVIAGIQWAADDAASKGISEKSVANMSLGGGVSKSLNKAVAALVAQGVTMCVAAGNESEDARNSSPASEPTAVTVGATDVNDSMAYFSNYGPLVDIFAPGVDIKSTWINEWYDKRNNNTNTISGTSMATPHVTGLTAYLIGKESLSGATAVTARLKELAGKDLISGLDSESPNALANNGVSEA